MIKLIPLLRILLGGFFVTLGFLKLITPYQNFLYIVQTYELSFLPEIWVAISIPWIELLLGVFLLAGLWTKLVARLFSLLSLTFILVISQALVRGLPIEDCGCFGKWLSMPLEGMLGIDIVLFLAFFYLAKNFDKNSTLSLDKIFDKPSS